MKIQSKIWQAAAVAGLLVSALVPAQAAVWADGPVAGGGPTVDIVARPPQNGTTLTATKTATGYMNRTITYDWTLTKSADPTAITLAQGASATIHYTLVATRGEPTIVDVYGVTGEICVTNGGGVTTENLTIVDQVQYKVGSGQFQDLPGATVTIVPAPLAPSESGCYAYDIPLTPIAGAIYRNVAHVTITNHSGWLPGGRNCPGPALCPFGPDPKADFSLPTEPTSVTIIDAEADLTDVLTCPAGFTCNPASVGPWHLTASQTITYDIVVTNVSACAITAQMPNVATLTEATSGQTHTANANVTITAPACSSGCTRTIGFWKNHAGGGPQQDLVTPLLPIWLGTAGGSKSVQVTTASQAIYLLNMSGNPSNGINKLYAQMLAAKLNIASGASASAVSATIAAADAFLATKNASDWSSLSGAQRQQVLAWMTTFDQYNNGVIGPGHCDCNLPTAAATPQAAVATKTR